MPRLFILIVMLLSGALYGFDDPPASDSKSESKDSGFVLDRYQSVDRYQRSDRYHQVDRYQQHDRFDNKTYSSERPYQPGSSIYGHRIKSYQPGSSIFGRSSKSFTTDSNKSAGDKD